MSELSLKHPIYCFTTHIKHFAIISGRYHCIKVSESNDVVSVVVTLTVSPFNHLGGDATYGRSVIGLTWTGIISLARSGVVSTLQDRIEINRSSLGGRLGSDGTDVVLA